MNTPTSLADLKTQTDQIIDQPISEILNAYGFVLYLKIGRIRDIEAITPSGKKYPATEADWTLSANGNWKFWDKDRLVIDSRTQEREIIDRELTKLLNSKLIIRSLTWDSKFEKTTLLFTNDVRLTITPDQDDTETWAICTTKLQQWLSIKGEVVFKQRYNKI